MAQNRALRMFLKTVDGTERTFDVKAWRAPNGADGYEQVGDVVDDLRLVMEQGAPLVFDEGEEATILSSAAITSITVQPYDPSAPSVYFA